MIVWDYCSKQHKTGAFLTVLLTWIVALVPSLLWQVNVAEGLSLDSRISSSGESGGNAVLSRMENAQCALQLLVGRIPGTAMPPEWAASGAKLALPLEIEFCRGACTYSMNKEQFLGNGKPSFRSVEPLNEPTFVSVKGVEHVKVKPGAYGCEIQCFESQKYSFRFFLDFPNGAIRNDIELPAERIYFVSSCWIQNPSGLKRAQEQKLDAETALKTANQELEDLEKSSTNFFQKALSLRQATILVERRSSLKKRLNELEQNYPLRPDSVVEGPNGMIFPREGFIAVKRFRGSREQYHWVGTFTFEEFFKDE